MVLGLPEVSLRPFVDRYVGYRERADVPLVRRERAGVFVVLILGWGAPLDVTDPRSAERGVTAVDSFVAGTFDSWCTTSTVGVGEGVELLLAPLTARRLLGLPLSELTNRAVGVGQLPGRWLDRLRVRLAEAPGWPERFALLDRVLAARLVASPPVDPRLDVGVAVAGRQRWAGERRRARRRAGLEPAAPRVPVPAGGRAATQDGRPAAAFPAGSHRVAPARRGWAGRRLGRGGGGCGYYDQSHLIRDFHQFAGATPAALLAAR